MNQLDKHKAELHLKKAYDYLHYAEHLIDKDLKDRVINITLDIQNLMKDLHNRS